jgi:flagellar motor switch protein FliN
MQRSNRSRRSPSLGRLGPDEVERLLDESARTAARPSPAEQVWTDPGVIERLFGRADEATAAVADQTAERRRPEAAPFELEAFPAEPSPPAEPVSTDRAEAELDVQIELGHTRMHLADVLELRHGSVVPLDQLAGDPVEVYVDGRRIARGEVVVLDDKLCVRVTELPAGGLVNE